MMDGVSMEKKTVNNIPNLLKNKRIHKGVIRYGESEGDWGKLHKSQRGDFTRE